MRKFLLVCCFLSGGNAFSVEATTSSPASRYSLVGIISETRANAAGIAVLRDESTQRTLTLRSGEFLPGDTAFQLHRVEKGQVIISDGDANIALSFAGRSKDVNEKEEATEEEVASVIAAVSAAEEEAAAKSDSPAKGSSLSKIIWPGGDDTVTFAEIEEQNKLLLKQIPPDFESENKAEGSEETSGH